MITANKTTIDAFIIQESLISPVEKIIKKLKDNEMRDCDINWLDIELEKYTKFACKTMNISIIVPSQIGIHRNGILNHFLVDEYVDRFNTLLRYFKTF